ncbi:hypothetical protein RND71_025801 [Anisodus tanguticus]|uniref:Uncharacterized protein n=1 Tax=Anisodus tanguticus TaxID=243964 RepID=A0AAE1RMA5_9SOLA|nr:hypothetical protein RND71_025801 [Anisodus tanguticus]
MGGGFTDDKGSGLRSLPLRNIAKTCIQVLSNTYNFIFRALIRNIEDFSIQRTSTRELRAILHTKLDESELQKRYQTQRKINKLKTSVAFTIWNKELKSALIAGTTVALDTAAKCRMTTELYSLENSPCEFRSNIGPKETVISLGLKARYGTHQICFVDSRIENTMSPVNWNVLPEFHHYDSKLSSSPSQNHSWNSRNSYQFTF